MVAKEQPAWKPETITLNVRVIIIILQKHTEIRDENMIPPTMCICTSCVEAPQSRAAAAAAAL